MPINKRKKEPEVIYRGDKPRAVILDIDEYQELLERIEDAYDLNTLKDIRRKGVKFSSLEDVLERR